MKSKHISVIMIILLLLTVLPVVLHSNGFSISFYLDLDSFVGSKLFSIVLSFINTALIVIHMYKATGEITLSLKKYHIPTVLLAIASCVAIFIIYATAKQSDKLILSGNITIYLATVVPICLLILMIFNYIFAKDNIVLLLFNYFWICCFACIYNMNYYMSSHSDIAAYTKELEVVGIPTLITGITLTIIAFIAVLVYLKKYAKKRSQHIS